MPTGVQSLLHQVAAVIARNRAARGASGERFQIFRLLGLENKEVKLHTPLLGDLLSPDGSHGQGALYLRLFLEHTGITDLDADKTTLSREHSLGPVTEDSGGRLDLRLTDRHRVLMIENKIHAADGDNQLSRYREHDRFAHLLYLTLDGRAPSNVTQAEMDRIHCKCISYAETITGWLRACIELDQPLRVREVLRHYLDTVMNLTQQAPDSMTNEIIQAILSSRETHEAFYALRFQTDALKTELFRRLRMDVEAMSRDFELGLERCDADPGSVDGGWEFSSELLRANNLKIAFCFEKAGYCKLAFGFLKIDKDKPCPDGLLLAFKAKSSYHSSNEWWPAWSYLEQPFGDWTQGGTQSWEALRTGEFAQALRRKIPLLLEIAQDAGRADRVA